MALYDYQCTNSVCNHIEEINHKIADNSEHLCKKCDTIMKKMISASAFKLKGEGWYSSGFSSKK